MRREGFLGGLTPGRRPGVTGFTLIEVLLAITLSAMVLLAAHRIFTGVVDGTRRLNEARAELDRAMNARRWLTAAVGSLEVGDQGGPFVGKPDQVAFGSWHLTPEGWLTRRRVALGDVSGRFVALPPQGDPLVLADSVRDVQFDYLLDPGENATWVREWISPVSAPLAIRMRITRSGCGMPDAGCVDTLLLIIGPRG
jgi:prepilin-type N-terminal cleavage/methylation domain-containing protein